MKKYSYEFKTQAVEKALGRDPDVSLRHIAIHLGVKIILLCEGFISNKGG